jgi:hypothetical protein
VDTGSGEENPANIFKAERKVSRLKLNTIIMILYFVDRPS